MFAIYFEDFHN